MKAPYKAKHDWTDHCGTTIKKGDYVIDLVYWDRPSTGDPLLFEDEAKKATVHAEHVLHANVAPAPAADDRVRVSEAVVAEIETAYAAAATPSRTGHPSTTTACRPQA